MHARLCCARCGAALVPAMSGLRCPRLTACGRGGLVEAGRARFFATGAERAEA